MNRRPDCEPRPCGAPGRLEPSAPLGAARQAGKAQLVAFSGARRRYCSARAEVAPRQHHGIASPSRLPTLDRALLEARIASAHCDAGTQWVGGPGTCGSLHLIFLNVLPCNRICILQLEWHSSVLCGRLVVVSIQSSTYEDLLCTSRYLCLRDVHDLKRLKSRQPERACESARGTKPTP